MSAPLTATTMDTQTGFAGSHQSGGTFSNSSSSNTTAANSTGNTGVQPTPKLQMNGVDTQVDTMLSAFDSGVNAASQGLDLDLDFFNKICGDDNTNYSNSNAPSFGLCDASPVFGSSRPSTLTSSFIPSPTTPLFTNGPAQMPCLSPVPPMTQQQQQQQQQHQNLDSFASLLSSARPQLNHQSFPALGMCTPNFNNHSMNTPGFPPNPITNFEEFRAVNRQTISLILAASTSPNVHSPRFQNQFDRYNQKQLVQDFAATAASLDVSTPNTPTVPPMYNNNMSMAAILSGTPTFAAPQQRPSAINTSNSRKTSPIKSSGLSPQNSNIMQHQQQMLTPVFQIPAPMPDLPFSSFNNQAFDLPFSAIMSNNNNGSHGMNGLYGSKDEDGDFDGADTHLGSGSDAASQIPITATKDASGKSIFLCPWDGCGRQFTRPYNLRSHYRQHTGERPFVCTQCPMSFSRHHDLKRHMLIHGGGKQHVCPACSRSFLRSDALKRHLKPAGDDSRLSKCMQIIQIKGISLEGYNC